MKLLILTEGGARSGFGHLTRTAAIAAAVRKLLPRSEIKFYVDGDLRAKTYAKTLGFAVRIESWTQDWNSLKKDVQTADAILVDSYTAPLVFCKKMVLLNSKCFWVDDYGRLPYPAGTVVVPGPYKMPNLKLLPKDVPIYSGKEYVILRDAFRKAGANFLIRKTIKHVLILLGGTGNAKTVKKLMECLKPENLKLKFTWVAPQDALAPRIDHLKIEKNISAEKMVRLMLKSDLALSSAGQTLYELAAVGVPVIAVQIAENQRQNILALTKTGFLKTAGSGFSAQTLKKMKTLFSELKKTELRRKISRKGRQSVDCGGANRIAELLIRGDKERDS